MVPQLQLGHHQLHFDHPDKKVLKSDQKLNFKRKLDPHPDLQPAQQPVEQQQMPKVLKHLISFSIYPILTR